MQTLILSIVILTFLDSCQNIEQEKPNIILINIDDLGWRDLGFMGSDFYETPNIDKLSKKGMAFSNGYASASNCAPSRACLMTGLWPSRHGIYTVNSSERGKSKNRKLIPIRNTKILSDSFVTLPEILKTDGYQTCHSGKWHISQDPLNKGFDMNIGGAENGHPKSYYPPYKNVDLEAPNGEYLTDLIMSKTIDFVKTTQKPFFLNYAPYAVHTPIQGVDSLTYKYENKPDSNGQNNSEYATMIENLDRNIGLLITTLEELDLIKNTLLIFTSDNGGLYGITNQKPLRAGKGSYYEGGIRVPFFMIWEGKILENTRSNFPVTQLDILPTILEFADIKTSQKLDGQSLVSVLQGEKYLKPRPLFWHFPIYLGRFQAENQNRDPLFRTRPGSVIRFDEWKLHQYFENGDLELYNLKKDPSEAQNLANEFPEKTAELLKILNDWQVKTKAPIPTELNPKFENFSNEN